MWKMIDGYKWPYRINEDARIQKYSDDGWVDIRPSLYRGRSRAVVKMRLPDGTQKEVPVVWLMADAFMGGRRPGYAIVHKDGAKLNSCLWNLEFRSMSGAATMSCKNRRRPVLKIDREGNIVEIYKSLREASEKEYVNKNSVMARCFNRVQNPYDLTGYTYQYEDLYYQKKRGRKKKSAVAS